MSERWICLNDSTSINQIIWTKGVDRRETNRIIEMLQTHVPEGEKSKTTKKSSFEAILMTQSQRKRGLLTRLSTYNQRLMKWFRLRRIIRGNI